MKTLLVLLVVLVVAFPMFAQQPPQVRSANERIAAKDFDGAIAILEEFTTKQPNRGGALLLLGRTYAQKGDVASALRTYEKAAKLPAFRGQASFEIAVIHAGKGEADKAFAMLRRVRASGSFDYDLFRTDARLETLRKDARFASLLPKPADFEKPFVEKTRVIHELRGEAKGAQFGWIARRIGDVDGDRAADFVTSAPTYPVDGSPAGRVYVYSGRSGKLLWQRTGKAGETLGIGLEAAGDTNKDGVGDVIAAGPGSGYAYVFSGRDGATLLTLGDGDANAQFGQHASGTGDVNGDGHADV
ncbi:MAG TPA: tetratricopeptide repeat protein, partial [Thermoanaerobaculia bacterium]